jgi:hypothetical protein
MWDPRLSSKAVNANIPCRLYKTQHWIYKLFGAGSEVMASDVLKAAEEHGWWILQVFELARGLRFLLLAPCYHPGEPRVEAATRSLGNPGQVRRRATVDGEGGRGYMQFSIYSVESNLKLSRIVISHKIHAVNRGTLTDLAKTDVYTASFRFKKHWML